MNDRLKEIWEKMQKRLDLVTLAALGLILVGAGFLLYYENNFTLPQPPQPPVNQWKEKFDVPGIEGEVDQKFAVPTERVLDKFHDPIRNINDDAEASRLIVRNMFEQKTAEEAEQAREEINRQYQAAEALWNEGKNDEAMKILNQILASEPAHPLATDLKRQIEEKLQNPAETN